MFENLFVTKRFTRVAPESLPRMQRAHFFEEPGLHHGLDPGIDPAIDVINWKLQPDNQHVICRRRSAGPLDLQVAYSPAGFLKDLDRANRALLIIDVNSLSGGSIDTLQPLPQFRSRYLLQAI